MTWLRKRLTQYRVSTIIVLTSLVAVWLAIEFYREPLTLDNLDDVETLTEIEKDVWEIEWSPDRTKLALVSWEKPVDIRESLTLFPIKTVGAGKKIIHFAFSPDPNMVAYCENGSTVEILNLQTKARLVLDAVNAQPRMKFSPDGLLVATGGYGDSARIWNVTNGELTQTLGMGEKGGLTVVFSPDGTKLAIGNRNSTTRLFEVVTGKLLHELKKRCSHGLAFHPNGEVLAIGYVDGSLILWDVATGKVKQEVQTGAEEIYRVDWSPDGKLLGSCGLNAAITIWGGENLVQLQALESPEWVIGLKFSPDGSRLITAGGGRQPGSPRKVRVWGVAPF